MGILYAKDLILVDPDDGVEISAVLSFRYYSACLPHVSSCWLEASCHTQRADDGVELALWSPWCICSAHLGCTL